MPPLFLRVAILSYCLLLLYPNYRYYNPWAGFTRHSHMTSLKLSTFYHFYPAIVLLSIFSCMPIGCGVNAPFFIGIPIRDSILAKGLEPYLVDNGSGQDLLTWTYLRLLFSPLYSTTTSLLIRDPTIIVPVSTELI